MGVFKFMVAACFITQASLAVNSDSYEYQSDYNYDQDNSNEHTEQLYPSSSSSEEGLSGRIVGGRPAESVEAPYQLSLLWKGERHSGASLVVSERTGMQRNNCSTLCCLF